MQISNIARIGKLTSNLVSNPNLIFPYVSKSLLNKKLPIDDALPWWSFRAIEYADKIFPGKSIFEFGTGGSTLRYASLCKSITSVEDNAEWLKVVQDRLEKNNIDNVSLIYRYFDFEHPAGFSDSEYIKAYDASKQYDVVIIDGQDQTFRERIDCFRYVEPTIKAGGIIVVDDWWRYVELLDSNRAKSVKVLESVGPCRYGVTSTAFFHY
jgi:predicted O-methyltransferase YrrM